MARLDELDPMRSLGRYSRTPAIDFKVGGADEHIPASNARDLADALEATYPDGAFERLLVTD